MAPVSFLANGAKVQICLFCKLYFRYLALGIALRYVLEALKKPSGSKMFCFGIAALDRFKTRLKDYPSYCQHLAAIPHFHQFQPQLIEVNSVIVLLKQTILMLSIDKKMFFYIESREGVVYSD